jgi:Fe-S cluster assembly scaffold protein SufB
VIVEKGTHIKNPVHMCFGMVPEIGTQKLNIDMKIEDDSKIEILAHCVFPNAKKIKHIMDAKIDIGINSRFSYFERHIHSENGGVEVIPKATIKIGENSRYYNEFELLKGRAGLIDFRYEVFCSKNSVLEMLTRINSKGDDIVRINEIGHLDGDRSKGFLNSRVAARDRAKVDVYNKLTASGSYARGHVDCKEIIKDDAIVSATPVVEVSNPKAHITHEASLGSVDSKQLQTLMARGISEDEATELIIQGLLK